MAITKTTDLGTQGTAYWNPILEGAIFTAREEALMPSLVTTYTATGYANRILPIYPTLSAQEVNEGQDYANATSWTKTTSMTLTPKEAMVQVVLTDRNLESDPDSARRDAAIEMGRAIAAKIDTDILGLFSSFSSGKGTAGSSLTIAHCAAALSKLRDNNATGQRTIVLHPYQWHDIWAELGQPATNSFLGEVANEALRQYYVGNWIAAQWFISANISGVGTAYGAAFTREAMALDTRKAPNLEVERDASLRAYELNMQVGYAVGERRDDHGVYIVSDATEPA